MTLILIIIQLQCLTMEHHEMPIIICRENGFIIPIPINLRLQCLIMGHQQGTVIIIIIMVRVILLPILKTPGYGTDTRTGMRSGGGGLQRAPLAAQ